MDYIDDITTHRKRTGNAQEVRSTIHNNVNLVRIYINFPGFAVVIFVLGNIHLTSRVGVGVGPWFFSESKYFFSLRSPVEFFLSRHYYFSTKSIIFKAQGANRIYFFNQICRQNFFSPKNP